jgi:hypothetical protein
MFFAEVFILEGLQRRVFVSMGFKDLAEAVIVAASASASSLFRDEYVMKGTMLEVKLLERGRIEVERSYTALDGKNGSGVVTKNSGERPSRAPNPTPGAPEIRLSY